MQVVLPIGSLCQIVLRIGFLLLVRPLWEDDSLSGGVSSGYEQGFETQRLNN